MQELWWAKERIDELMVKGESNWDDDDREELEYLKELEEEEKAYKELGLI